MKLPLPLQGLVLIVSVIAFLPAVFAMALYQRPVAVLSRIGLIAAVLAVVIAGFLALARLPRAPAVDPCEANLVWQGVC